MTEDPEPSKNNIENAREVIHINQEIKYKVTSDTPKEQLLPAEQVLMDATQQTLDVFYICNQAFNKYHKKVESGSLDASSEVIFRDFRTIYDLTAKILVVYNIWEEDHDGSIAILEKNRKQLDQLLEFYSPIDQDEPPVDYPYNSLHEARRIRFIRDGVHSVNTDSFGISSALQSYDRSGDELRDKIVATVKGDFLTLNSTLIDAVEVINKGYPEEIVDGETIQETLITKLRHYGSRRSELRGLNKVGIQLVAEEEFPSISSNKAYIAVLAENIAKNAVDFVAKVPKDDLWDQKAILQIDYEDDGDYINIIISDNGIGLKLDPGQERVDYVMGKSSSGGNGVGMASLAETARGFGGDLYLRPRKDGQRGAEVVLRVKKATSLPQ